ncbi:Hsp20/alpha crystallin family protein [Fundidesulfovibrio butyratiphilus]
MAKLNWNPWIGLTEVKTEEERLLRRTRLKPDQPGGLRNAAYFWTPVADVLESPEAFVICVELPGVDHESVVVEMKSKTLWIYGERRQQKPCEGEGVFHAVERSYGPFARRFSLPKGVDLGAVSAVFRNGLLEVTIPKERREARRRRIPIF